MKLLDLFCGAGGAAMGYHQAGFDQITGVDIAEQKRYPFEFVQADALEYLSRMIESGEIAEFHLIHASPPCQAYTLAKNNGCHRDAPELVDPVRDLLLASRKPYVIENVPGAPLLNPVELCGASFGLGVGGFDLNRHRLFETNPILIFILPCQHKRGQTIGVYGNGTNTWHREKFGRCITVAEMRQAMGIGWMTRKELSQAIPPAYTKWIARQLIALGAIKPVQAELWG